MNVTLSRPEWDRSGDEFEFRWTHVPISVRVSHIRERGDGVRAELEVRYAGKLVDHSYLSMLTARERSSLAKHLTGRAHLDSLDWSDVLAHVTTITVAEYRRERPARDTAIGEVAAVDYHLAPTVKRNVSTLFFGDFAVGKTTLAYAHGIACGYNVVLPGGIRPVASGPVMILDYEMNEDPATAAVRALLRGMEVPWGPGRVYVKHLVAPIADVAAALRTELADLGIALVVLDSQSQAMDTNSQGDAANPAKAMMRALSSFGVTSIIIGQIAKAESRRDGSREPYGARHISYACEDTWEFRGEKNPVTQALTTVMFHRKSRGCAQPPAAFTVEFPQEGVRLLRAGAVPDSLEDERDSVAKRIVAFLTSHGMATPKEIITALGTNENTVRSTLLRLKLRGKLVTLGDQYGVAARQAERSDE